MAIEDQIIGAESGGDPNAKNPNSTASGLGQFTNSTWLDMIKAHRPDLAEGQSDEALLGLKNDPNLSREMTGAYAQDNAAILSKNGLSTSPGSIYLAHFAGPGGAVKVLQAVPDAPVSDILGPAAVAANPFLKNMSAGDLQAWAAKKVGATSPIPGPAPAQASPTAPSAPPAPPLPQQQKPIFASPTPAPAQVAPPAFAPSQAPQPIFARQQTPNLDGLRAALAASRASIFPRA